MLVLRLYKQPSLKIDCGKLILKRYTGSIRQIQNFCFQFTYENKKGYYMKLSDLEHFKDLLYEKEHNILEWLGSPTQAYEDDANKAQELLTQIKGAIGRIEDRSYGTCESCKDAIELYRLEVQPVTEVCLGCISAQERAMLEEELFLASKIHRALLPQNVEKIDGFEIAVKSLAARIVGGDYYDFLPARNTGVSRVVIADTMGKGLPAGLLMSNVQGALRVLSEDIISPQKLIGRLNEWLCRNVPVTKFISLICIAIEQDREHAFKLAYTNAGHCPAILIRNDGSTERLEPNGGVIGVHPGFEYEECQLQMSSGDLLVLFTDGVTEAENCRNELFGEERLLKYSVDHRSKSLDSFLDSLLTEVERFTERAELDDDLTVLLMRKT